MSVRITQVPIEQLEHQLFGRRVLDQPPPAGNRGLIAAATGVSADTEVDLIFRRDEKNESATCIEGQLMELFDRRGHEQAVLVQGSPRLHDGRRVAPSEPEELLVEELSILLGIR